MTISFKTSFALAALVAGGFAAEGAKAQTIAALVGDDMLVAFDAKSGKQTKSWKIAGLPGPIVGIDVRPADGMLYALSSDGTVSTIDTATGKATPKTKLETMLAAGVKATVDFNPVADRMRVIGTDGTNLRANVDDGKVIADKPLNFADADANKGKKAMVIAGAYSNSVKGTKETALYDIDATGNYVKQAPPNDGILNTLGATGVKGDTVAFDILSDGSKNWGFLVSGKVLYSLDLATGKTAKAADLAWVNGKPVKDIAVLGN